MKALIEVAEVAALLRDVLTGRVPVLSDLSALDWSRPSIQDIEVGNWRLVIFIEADIAKEIEIAYAPDGRVQDFTPAPDTNPMQQLSENERRRFEMMLGCPE